MSRADTAGTAVLGAGPTPLATRSVELPLAADPTFGDAGLLLGKALATHDFLLELLSERSEACRSYYRELTSLSVAARRDALRDPVCRNLTRDVLPLGSPVPAPRADRRECLFTTAASLLQIHPGGSPLRLAAKRAMESTRGLSDTWVWDPDLSDSPMAAAFCDVFSFTSQAYPEAQLVRPSPRHRAVISAAASLLLDILPVLGRSVLAHVHLIAVADTLAGAGVPLRQPRPIFVAPSGAFLPGVVVLSPASLENVWVATEALFHEAVHCRLYDLSETGSLFKATPAPGAPLTIHPPWHAPGSVWTIDRGLAAYHVYVHLCCFFSGLLLRRDALLRNHGPFGSFDPPSRSRAAYNRSLFLADQLELYLPVAFSPFGVAFLQWLRSLLMDPLSKAALETSV